jgi:hypothetical protein
MSDNANSNKNITEVNELSFRSKTNTSSYGTGLGSYDVSEYKWELVSNESKVLFSKEGMKDKVSVSLSNIFDVWLKCYENHLNINQLDEKLLSEKEERRKRENLFYLLLNELMDSYELSLRQTVKEILIKQDILIPKISNIREVLREIFIYEYNSHNHKGDDPIHMKFFSHTNWFVENGEKLKTLSSYRKSSALDESESGMFQHIVLKNTCVHLHEEMLKKDYWFPKK